MGRAITGSMRERSGSCEVSFDTARLRTREVFPTREQAEAFRAAAVAALTSPGRALPDPNAYRGASPAPGWTEAELDETPLRLAAEAWFRVNYLEVQRADVSRRRDVRRYLDTVILPFFETRLGPDVTCQQLDYQARHEFRMHLGGRDREPAQSTPAGAFGNVPRTARAAAELCRVSKSTIDRARRAGTLAAEQNADGCWTYTPEALRAAGLLEAPARGGGYAKSTARGILSILDEVLGHAEERGARGVKPRGRLSAIEPHDRDRKRAKRRPQEHTTLEQTRELAAELQVIHQVVLWMLRLLGLRKGEAFGPLVGDLFSPAPDLDVLVIDRQGGRVFHTLTADGEVEAVTRKAPKTKQSVRVLVLPRQVAAMLRTIVEVFHTDPETGAVDLEARLIPDLSGRGAGQSAFTAALSAACNRLGIDHFRAHELRKDLITELHDLGGLSDVAIRRFHGHAAGTDVHAVNYLKDSPQMRQLRRLAEALTAEISVALGEELIVPTTRTPKLVAGSDLAARWPGILGRLQDAGWYPLPVDPDEEMLDAVQAADLLGEHVNTTRRAMARGELPVVVGVRNGRSVQLCRAADVVAARERRGQRVTLNGLAAELGHPYHQLYAALAELGHRVEKREGQKEGFLSAEAADALRAWSNARRELNATSMTVAAAAVALGRADSTIRQMLKRGELGAVAGHQPTRVLRAEVEQMVAAAGPTAEWVSERSAAARLGVDVAVIRFFVSQGRARARRRGADTVVCWAECEQAV